MIFYLKSLKYYDIFKNMKNDCQVYIENELKKTVKMKREAKKRNIPRFISLFPAVQNWPFLAIL